MATLEEKLKDIIREDLQGQPELETLPNGHVSGDVISPLFAGKDYGDRRALIRDALKKRVESGALTDDEYVRVSTFITYSPEEWEVVLTDSSD